MRTPSASEAKGGLRRRRDSTAEEAYAAGRHEKRGSLGIWYIERSGGTLEYFDKHGPTSDDTSSSTRVVFFPAYAIHVSIHYYVRSPSATSTPLRKRSRRNLRPTERSKLRNSAEALERQGQGTGVQDHRPRYPAEARRGNLPVFNEVVVRHADPRRIAVDRAGRSNQVPRRRHP